MLTITFGSCAYYDSSPDYKISIDIDNITHSLAKELFSLRFKNIVKNYLISLPLINHLRRAFNIEHDIEVISTEYGYNIPEQLLKIRRYINHVIE